MSEEIQVSNDIKWLKKSGKLAECLLAPERSAELEEFICNSVNLGCSTQEIIEDLESRGDMTLNDWIAVSFSLGYFQGWNRMQ